jgi:uncharacterized protein
MKRNIDCIKNIFKLGPILSSFIFLFFTPAPTQGAVKGTPETVARTFINSLASEQYETADGMFDTTMRASMSPRKLKDIWNSLQAQNGKFEAQLTAQQQAAPAYTVVLVDCQFEKTIVSLQIAVSPAGKIGGFYIAQVKPKPTQEQPSQKTQEKPAPPAAPEPAKPAPSYTDKTVQIGEGKQSLPGTLAMPSGAGPFPAVVLVHGSGPHDRDETVGLNKPFLDLATGLAKNGVAVLRYEKRTKTAPQKMPANATVKEEVIDDTLAAVKLLGKTQGIDPKRIFVLGHSLGGTVSPRIAKANPQIAGLIIMAGSARPLEDVILEQTTYIDTLDGLTDQEKADLESLKKQVAKVKDPALSKDTPTAELPLGIPAPYWLDLRGYNPAEAAKDLPQRMLIIQGGRDYQVTNADFQIWKKALAAKKNAEFKLYPNLNHLFIDGKGKSTPKEYNIAGHIAKPVIDDIANWIKK